MRSLLCLLLVASFVSANTEIINIVPTTHPYADVNVIQVQQQWAKPKLNSYGPEQIFHLLPAPYGTDIRTVCEDDKLPCVSETWIALDFDDSADWHGFSAFTLRLSWPASSPADFLIETFTPKETQQYFAKKRGEPVPPPSDNLTEPARQIMTRRLYARIRSVSAGLRRPSENQDWVDPVQYVLLLEPLYLGVIPATVLPILGFLVPVVLIAAFIIAPIAHTYIEHVAGEIRATDPKWSQKEK